MRIAVNTRFLQANNLEGYGNFINELLQRITTTYTEHEFLFLFDRPFDKKFIYAPNITAKVIWPKAKHALSFRYWYDIKLTIAAKKFKANVIVSLDGFCSLTTSIPQVLAVHDLAFLHYPKFIPLIHLWFYKTHQPKFLKKASHIVTVSEFSKNDIVTKYSIDANKITNIYSAAKPIFKPVQSFSIKQIVKDKYAGGQEYFLFVGGIHPRKNLLNLLKAFSLFKKWQKSSMKLLVVGRLAWQYNDIINKLNTFKYKDDVVLLNYLSNDDLAMVMASAYGMVFPSFFEGFGVPIVEAMQSGVPVITSNVSSMPEIAANAALFVNPNDVNSIANQMMLLYKDETIRNELIQKGYAQSAKFNWDDCATKLWQVILNTAKTKN